MLLCLAFTVGIYFYRTSPLPWHPSATLAASHHVIYSTAEAWQTQETANALTLLYASYSNRFGSIPGFQRDHPKLKVKLYKDRAEFRRVHRNLGWAEAFYRKPYCQAYYSVSEPNSCHWVLHESVHQLNREVAHLQLEKWLEEGLATYFSTSRLQAGQVNVGVVDYMTYPVWWIHEIATEPELAANLRNKSVIPLKAIVTNRGGPRLNNDFNLYYLHWWTLTHFLLESPRYGNRALELVQQGGGLEAFERVIGPIEQIQAEWHTHVRELKARLSGEHLKKRTRVGN